MIEFKHVSKIYNNQVAVLQDITLSVPEGKTVVLLGPSGCGKTTLLRMVNRLVPLSKGEIFINGKEVHHFNEIELRRSIGYVIQHNGLFPNMTIEQNVMIVPALLGWDGNRKQKRFHELMELIGLNPDEYRKRYPHQLSGGQQQRVGIARAMAADPPIMLMDEPFSALDPVIRNHLQDEFLNIQKQVRKTILFVSHDIDEAIKLGDYIAILNNGKLVQYDTPHRLLLFPKNEFVTNFTGKDQTLKQLSLYTIVDLVKAGYIRQVENSSMDKTIAIDTNLREALSKLLFLSDEQAVVMDGQEPVGIVHSQDIKQFLHSLTDSLMRKEVDHEERNALFQSV
ncbi:ABC transporter ATP-binding protein [Brevibacillus sp. H7]|uniref:ABC transporter ATP-binding protein n=1 Tax=Brevibacillus sp. H7 TaxID=3349138 RepID=UPI0038259C46